jgi:hypothetical protein
MIATGAVSCVAMQRFIAVVLATMACSACRQPTAAVLRSAPVLDASMRDAADEERPSLDAAEPDVSLVAGDDENEQVDESEVDDTLITDEPVTVAPPERFDRGWIADAEREPLGVDPAAIEPESRARCTPLPSPRRPAVPAALAADVARLRPLARRTADCHDGRFRIAHRPDPRCRAWFAQLAAGGPAAMHALGIELSTQRPLPGADVDASCGSFFMGTAALRAAETLASFMDPQAMPYLLRFLAIQIPMDLYEGYDGAAVEMGFEGVRRLAMRELGPPWREQAMVPLEHWTEVLRRWGHWYVRHRAERAQQWRDEGVALSRTRLYARNLGVRYGAAQTLEMVSAERARVAAVRASACREQRALELAPDGDFDRGMMLTLICRSGRGQRR